MLLAEKNGFTDTSVLNFVQWFGVYLRLQRIILYVCVAVRQILLKLNWRNNETNPGFVAISSEKKIHNRPLSVQIGARIVGSNPGGISLSYKTKAQRGNSKELGSINQGGVILLCKLQYYPSYI